MSIFNDGSKKYNFKNPTNFLNFRVLLCMRKNCSLWKPIILKLVILRMLSKNAKASTSFAPFHPSTLLLKFIYEHTIHKHNLSMGVNCKIMHFVSYYSHHMKFIYNGKLTYWIRNWSTDFPLDGANGIEELETHVQMPYI